MTPCLVFGTHKLDQVSETGLKLFFFLYLGSPWAEWNKYKVILGVFDRNEFISDVLKHVESPLSQFLGPAALSENVDGYIWQHTDHSLPCLGSVWASRVPQALLFPTDIPVVIN